MITPSDVCRVATNFIRWVGESCDPKSGVVLTAGPQVARGPTHWLPGLLHQEKCRILCECRATMVEAGKVLRGWIEDSERQYFWSYGDLATCQAASADPQVPTVRDEAQSWRDSLALLIVTSQTQQIKDPHDLWVFGRLVLLTRAPRTQEARQRITMHPKSVTTGDHLLVVLDFQGPNIWAYDVLQRRGPKVTPPLVALFSWTGEHAAEVPGTQAVARSNTVWQGLFTSLEDIKTLPSALNDRLDNQQQQVLLDMSQEHRRVVCQQVFAGTGKTHMAMCLLYQMLRSKNMDDSFIIWAVRTRTLRDEILGSLTSNGVLQCVGDLLLVGAPPSTSWIVKPRVAPQSM